MAWPAAHGAKPSATALQQLAGVGITIMRLPDDERSPPKPAGIQATRSEGPARTTTLLKLLEDGPGLSCELAAELGVNTHNAASHLSNLAKRGKVLKAPFPSSAARPPMLWQLKVYKP